jgi:hypothetical protein
MRVPVIMLGILALLLAFCMVPTVQAVTYDGSISGVVVYDTLAPTFNVTYTTPAPYYPEADVSENFTGDMLGVACAVSLYRSDYNATHPKCELTIYQDGSAPGDIIYQANGTANPSIFATTVEISFVWADVNQTLDTGHEYYLLFETNGTLSGVPYIEQTTLTFREHPADPAAVNWMMGIIYMLLLFAPAWILNWFLPKLGLMIGLMLMSIILFLGDSDFIMVTAITVMAIGGMFYSMRGD